MTSTQKHYDNGKLVGQVDINTHPDGSSHAYVHENHSGSLGMGFKELIAVVHTDQNGNTSTDYRK
ncbi:hypothetical protein IPH92_01845 [Candidatus Kaiserbacteria bacterium]|nr:MAG: hypothetical protein IPH92_01845 [Candidatus Kaiserbacteria bacterium]